MGQYSNFSEVMEAENHFKNGASLKSHTSKRILKSLFIATCVLLLSYTALGQQIKSKSFELDDLIILLRASGYELFNFDITEMLKEQYYIISGYKEYSEIGEIASRNIDRSPNRRLLTDIPETFRQKMIDEGRIIDPETKAIAHAEKITFGFFPSGNDSTARMQINLPGFMTWSGSLKLRGISIKDSDKKIYIYHIRPFKIGAFKEDTFIPLVLLGSSWYDEKIDNYRFCGEPEIDPDMSSNVILKDIPHYYVFGMTFIKKQ